MAALTEEIINGVLEEIRLNVRRMIDELWMNWSHLGVDDDTKVHNIMKLVLIEKDLHRDVVSETRQQLKVMQEEVDKLKKETVELSQCLSTDITIMDFKDNMMLSDYKKELEDRIAGYREQVQQRRMKMERLLEWQRDLADKLGVAIMELQEVPLPSEDELDKLKAHLEVLQAERDKRVENFLNIQVEVKDIMEQLQIKPTTKFEQEVTSSLSVDFKVTDLNMDRLAKLHQELQERYHHTNNRVLELRERLSRLWECLDEELIYRENFLRAHPGCHPAAEAALKEEIKRCDNIKKQKIQVFIANVRTKIKLMWDRVMYSQREREEFVHYFRDEFSEDTLTLHEIYLEKLTKFYDSYKNIFDLVVTRKTLWLKMTELEARATEPGRYHNRGGQLLKEEKERKTIASRLPKIEELIRELVTQYESKTGKTFTVDGKPLLQLMADDWETRKAERTNKLSARKQALTPTTTPLLRSLATSPLGKRNRTAAGLATAEKNRPPQKRQLITGSANKAMSAVTGNQSAFKRSAVTTVKRRISGRLAAKGFEGRAEAARKKLDYAAGPDAKTPKVTVSSNILKHKRRSQGKRRSSSRLSMSTTHSATSKENTHRDLLLESTLLTTYTDFKERINEDQVSRSSMANHVIVKVTNADDNHTPKKTPRKAPMTPKIGKENIHANVGLTPKIGKENIHANVGLTPKIGKENIHANVGLTPKSSLMYTPTRLTRSAIKLDPDGFLTPRAPLSATKQNLPRQNTVSALTVNTPPAVNRSKSHMNLLRTKNFPPLI